MLISQIKIFARFHFNNNGWIATDVSNYTYWFRNKPTFANKLGLWIDNTRGTSDNIILICTKTKLLKSQYNKARFKL